MAHAEDLAYLREKIGAGKFEDWVSDVAEELRQLEAECEAGLPGNAKVDLGRLDVYRGKVPDIWRQPRPVRYRSKSA